MIEHREKRVREKERKREGEIERESVCVTILSLIMGLGEERLSLFRIHLRLAFMVCVLSNFLLFFFFLVFLSFENINSLTRANECECIYSFLFFF